MNDTQRGSIWIIIALILVVIVVGIYYLQTKMGAGIVIYNDTETPSYNNLKIYKDNQARFSFSYPYDWNVHVADSEVYVLTKQHDMADNPGEKTIDFSVSVCKLSDQICATKKQELDQMIKFYSENQDTTLSLDGKNGNQFVTAGAGYYYSGVIEDGGNLYVIGSAVEEYETRYPTRMTSQQVKAIFNSFNFYKK